MSRIIDANGEEKLRLRCRSNLVEALRMQNAMRKGSNSVHPAHDHHHPSDDHHR